MMAVGAPVSGSKQAMIAWCVGQSVFCGNRLTSFVVSAPADGRKAGIAARKPWRSATNAAIRVGTSARPG